MPTTANKVSGNAGTVSIGGVDFQVTKWNAKVTIDDLEVTNMASGGWKEYIPGLRGCEGSFDATFDNVLNASGAPLTTAQAAFSLTLGSHTLTFTGNVFGLNYDVDVAGLTAISGDYKATSTVVFS